MSKLVKLTALVGMISSMYMSNAMADISLNMSATILSSTAASLSLIPADPYLGSGDVSFGSALPGGSLSAVAGNVAAYIPANKGLTATVSGANLIAATGDTIPVTVSLNGVTLSGTSATVVDKTNNTSDTSRQLLLSLSPGSTASKKAGSYAGNLIVIAGTQA